MQFLYSGITSGSIYALIAIGFNIIYNTTGIINFAQGEFVMLGGMFIYSLLYMMNVPFIFAFPVALFGAFVLGVLFERVFIRYVKVKTELNLITITIAGSIILRGLAMLIWGRDTLLVESFIPAKTIQLYEGTITSDSVLVIGVSLFISFFLTIFFKKTKYGKAFRACYEDKIAASVCGINVRMVVMFSFGIAAFLGAVAGVAVSPITYVTYNDGVMSGLKGFSAAVMGGLGSFWGGIFGGIILGVSEAFFASVFPSGYKDAMAFLIILLILFFRPQGILGRKKATRV
ncbi:branched-chain amino acid ABC transporter permease [Deferribacterales bacterium Es71-Z0220]|uniref:branched-chain amino acid ABC transporter permease n=1 Tax=Deferrivibrio essentukiensis TaxID=2880922 RepID=UPI001F60F882|nr:branched-chain amino acid ABC transporter permease [Deferrivibrio essentukiensis]MCB4204068.1 branched-chain amino acid ABC transporter permease [Deferrivibrio essentukiensis]